MKKKLSKQLQALIKRYITNRDSQEPGIHWDKEGDLAAIDKQAFADGFVRVEACCGSWWFSVKRGANRWVFYCHEDNYTQTLQAERGIRGSQAIAKLLA